MDSKPLRPRGGLDLKLFGIRSPKVLRSKPPRGLKKGPGGEKEIFLLHLPKRGHNKTDSIAPFVEGGAVVSSSHGPGGPRQFCQRHPLWKGQRQQILQSPVLILTENMHCRPCLAKNSAESCVFSLRKDTRLCRQFCIVLLHRTPGKIGQRCPF